MTLSLSCSPVVEVTQDWFKWHGIDKLAVHWHILISIGGDLVQVDLQWHSDFAVAQWQCIGWTKILLMPNILLKSWRLIGRELGILASHWSRGPWENFLRGYPYNPECVPIELYWPQITLDWFIWGLAILAIHRSCTIETGSRGMILSLIDTGLKSNTGLVNWHRNGQLEFHWQCWEY